MEPILSICCITYNHENYIAETIEGFLAQKTNFEYEIIIHDDASTDATQLIIQDYATKYSNKIRVVLQKENQLSKGIKPFAQYVMPITKGKYLAICEGDDFWNDPNKINTQIEFLENNPRYSACFHPVYWLENGKISANLYKPILVKDTYSENDVLENLLQITVCSTVFRKSSLTQMNEKLLTVPYWDNVLHYLNVRKGEIGYIDKPMATYRRHAKGYYSGDSEYNRIVNTLKTWRIIEREFGLENNSSLSKRYFSLFNKLENISLDKLNEAKKMFEIAQHKDVMKKSSNDYLLELKNKTAIEHFHNSKFYFYKHQFEDAEKEIEQYQNKKNYELFAKYDNRITNNPILSVIIVAYKTNKLLLECLNSLKKQTNSNFEIIVIDNGGNDEIEEQLFEENLLFVKCPINFILSEGRNIGTNFAKGKIIAFLDDDAISDENWIESIIRAFEENDIWGLRGKVLPKNPNAFIKTEAHYDLGVKKQIINYIDTEGNSAFLKEKYIEFGGMNPLLFGAEGFELSYRIFKKYGFGRILYSPEMIIYHDYASTDDKLLTKQKRHELMNQYLRWKYKDIDIFRTQIKKEIHVISKEYTLPFISICIPTYNRANYLKEAIESALNQNYGKYEIIIVDDGSTDNTKEVVDKFDSSKIRYIFKKNSGAPDTRNRCIKEAKGNYILWLDSDDLLVENIIQKYVHTLLNYPLADVVYGELKSFGHSDHHYKYHDWYNKKDDMIGFLYKGSPMPNGGSLIKKEVYGKIGGYNASFKRAHDYEFWARLALADKFACKYLPEITYLYRIHESNITGELSKATDYSYEAKILKNVVDLVGVKKLFPSKFWESNQAKLFGEAYSNLAVRFFTLNSLENALYYFLLSLDYDFSESQKLILDLILKDDNLPKIHSNLYRKIKRKSKTLIMPNIEVVNEKAIGFLKNKNDQNRPFVNIGMVTYNRLEFTKQSIESIIKFTQYPYSLTVIDNNSKDGTKEYLSELKQKGKIKNLVLLSANVGVAKASNLAWSLEPNAEYYLKYDNDIVIEKDNWLNNMVDIIEKIPQSGAVAYNFERKSYPLSEITGLKLRIKEEGNLGGACILIPKRTKDLIGVWNEEFGLYGEEDADYGFRIKASGLLNIYMEDENIGKHLPGGKAAIIDPQTLKAVNQDEANFEKEYREWKDNLRIANVKGGKYYQIINDYISGRRNLYYFSKFVGDYNNKIKDGNLSVSIVIPVFNKSHFTDQCLHSIFSSINSTQFEVIIIDNNSNDNTHEIIEKYTTQFNNISYLRNNVNLGFAKANNLGVEKSKNDIILLLNNDTVVTDGWIDNLLKPISEDKTVGAVSAKLLFEDNTIQHAGVVVIKDMQFGDPLVARHIHYKKDKNSPEVNEIMEYQALTAACLLIRKSAFLEVNGFDEEYWNGYEDVDLCFKLRERGYKLVYQPNSIVYHFESQSGAERFTKVKNNIIRLHNKWLNKIIPDYEISENGVITENQPRQIKPFLNSNEFGTKLFMCSIVVPIYNQLDYSNKFIKSLKKYTSIQFELIIIDNGSSKDTIEYLQNTESDDKRIKVIYNKENFGFPIAVNQGIKEAKGDYILIANNDIVLTENWLSRMIEVAESDPQIGIVGPVSNMVSGIQLDKNAKYNSIKEMHKYAAKIAVENKGKIQEFPRVAFLCTLIKKEVIDKIGGLDERFSPGNFEDDDFCLRAQIAGYKTVIAKDVFIHHYGSKSFTADGLDKYKERLEINKQIFVNKWGADPEEIWLKNKSIPRRNINYPINQNKFTQAFERSLILLEDKDYREAVVELQKTIEFINEKDPVKYSAITEEELVNLTATTFFELGNIEQANKFFKKELQINPSSSRACFGLAETFYIAELYEQAKAMYEWAIKNGKNDEITWNKLRIVNKQLNLDENNNSLDLVNVQELLQRAEEYINNDDFENALDLLDKILGTDENNIDALNDLSVIFILQNEIESALNVINKVIDLDSENEIAKNNLQVLENKIKASAVN